MERLCRTCNDEQGFHYDVELTGRDREREISLVLCDDCAAGLDEVDWITLAVSRAPRGPDPEDEHR